MILTKTVILAVKDHIQVISDERARSPEPFAF